MIKNKSNALTWFIIFAIFCTAVYALKSVLLPFVAGAIIGYLLDPLTTKLEKLGLNRTLATTLVILSVLVFLVPTLFLLFGTINEQVGNFISIIPDYIASWEKKLEPVLISLQAKFPNISAEKIREYIRENAADGLKVLAKMLKGLISGGVAFFSLLSLILITPVVAFYMLRDWNKFTTKVDSLLPKNHKKSIRNIFKDIDKTIAGFIRGQLSVCVLLGTYYSAGLYFIGLELGVLIGFIAGLISFIPYVGSITGFAVSMAVAFAQFDDSTHMFYVVAVFMTGQFIEGNFLTPKLVGDSVGLHPVWIMFALLSGGVLLGFLGLMLAVPIAAIIGVLIRHNIETYKKSSLYLEG